MKTSFLVFILIYGYCSCVHAQGGEDGAQMISRNNMQKVDSSNAAHRLFVKGVQELKKEHIKNAINLLTQASKRKHVLAKIYLAKIYFDGIGVEKDLSKAFGLYYELHKLEEPIGTYNCAVFLENGWGTPLSYQRAFELYSYAAKELNFPEAQRALGSMYFAGRGVEKDYKEAWKWYDKAARQGNARAIYNLALMLDKGWGIKKNSSESFKLFESAAKKGEVKAFIALGRKYETGEGVNRDYTIAASWYMKGTFKGDIECYYRSAMLLKNPEAYPVPDYFSSLEYFKVAAQKGHLDSYCEVALMYLNGQGVEADPATAAKWLSAAVEQKYERAQYLLGLLYLEGKGVLQDKAKGLALIQAAAGVNYPEAVKWLEENQ